MEGNLPRIKINSKILGQDGERRLVWQGSRGIISRENPNS